jgi:hypothetical protein
VLNVLDHEQVASNGLANDGPPLDRRLQQVAPEFGRGEDLARPRRLARGDALNQRAHQM